MSGLDRSLSLANADQSSCYRRGNCRPSQYPCSTTGFASSRTRQSLGNRLLQSTSLPYKVRLTIAETSTQPSLTSACFSIVLVYSDPEIIGGLVGFWYHFKGDSADLHVLHSFHRALRCYVLPGKREDFSPAICKTRLNSFSHNLHTHAIHEGWETTACLLFMPYWRGWARSIARNFAETVGQRSALSIITGIGIKA